MKTMYQSFLLCALLLFTGHLYAEDVPSFTDGDLQKYNSKSKPVSTELSSEQYNHKIKQQSILDKESAIKKDEELYKSEEETEMKTRKTIDPEQQMRDEKEIRETWVRVKKALTGK